MKTLKRFNLLP